VFVRKVRNRVTDYTASSLFVHYLCTDSLGSSDYIASNDSVISELSIGKEVDGRGHGLILYTILTFARRGWENHKVLSSKDKWSHGQELKPGPIENKDSPTHSTAIFG
jgi:hypothetical protein